MLRILKLMHACLGQARLACALASFVTAGALAADGGTARDRLALRGIEPTPERLVQFAAQGDATVVELLLEAGVHVGAADPRRRVTALHNAAAQGHVRLVRQLLERHADPDAADWEGNTPLINAAYFGQVEVVKILVAHGARLDIRSIGGATVLSAAVYSGKEPLLAWLMAQPAAASLSADIRDAAAAIAIRSQRLAMAAMIRQARPAIEKSSHD